MNRVHFLYSCEPRMPIQPSPTNAIEKTCRVIAALSDPHVRTLSQIAQATGIHKVSVLRILDVLAQEGFVERPAQSKQYAYGVNAHVMAASLRKVLPLRDVAEPNMARIAEASGDTVLLVLLQGDHCVCIARQTGGYPIHASTLYVGSRRPLGVGSGPLAVLAKLSSERQAQALQKLEAREKSFPRLPLSHVRDMLQESTARGYAVVYNDVVEQVGAIGLAICDRSGEPIGAISVSSLSKRVREREEELFALLKTEVAQIERRLTARESDR